MPVAHESRFAAPPEQVTAAAQRSLGLRPGADGVLSGTLSGDEHDPMPLRLDVAPAGDGGTLATFSAELPPPVPYFQWMLGVTARRSARGVVTWAAAAVAADLAGEGRPPEPKRSVFHQPAGFEQRQAVSIATVAAITVVAGMGASLFAQSSDFITEAYNTTDRSMGVAAAVTRAGVLMALVAAALADRVGRRRVLLWSVAGLCVSSALSALAPTLEVLTACQLVARGLFNAVFVVALIVAVEEAPEGGRAFAGAMITLAFGAGGALSTALLPLGDLGPEAWRLAFVVNGLMVLAVPGFARRLKESVRYEGLARRRARFGRIGELWEPEHRTRLLLVLGLALMTNVLAAPSSQFGNRFLGDERGFSGFEITLFRAVTGGIPGFVGLFIGGRLAETWGRKRVAMGGVLVAAVTTAAFFVSDGLLLWVWGTTDLFAAAVAAPALQAFGPEMFPTEIRGTANAAILVTGLTGSVVGLVVAGLLSETMSLGSSVAVLAVVPLLAVFLIPPLPEAARKDLDVVSPPEV